MVLGLMDVTVMLSMLQHGFHVGELIKIHLATIVRPILTKDLTLHDFGLTVVTTYIFVSIHT